MNESEVPGEVIALAMSTIHARLQDFPQNEWTDIGHNFKLHMFIEQDEFRYQTAHLHKVVDGNVDVQFFVRMWEQHIVDEEYKQFQLEQDAQMEADYLAREEAVDRAINAEEPLGLTYSRLNPHGVFTPDGQQIGSTCGCEDYPCCGH